MIRVVEYKSKHCHSVRSLIDLNFGDGYSKTKIIEDGYGWCALNLQNEVVGFSFLKVEKKTGVLDLIVVEESNRKNGIGKSLFDIRLNKAKRLGVSIVVINHWVKKDSEKPYYALKHGFKFEKRNLNYWSKESMNLGYKCAECKTAPCECVSDTYILKLFT